MEVGNEGVPGILVDFRVPLEVRVGAIYGGDDVVERFVADSLWDVALPSECAECEARGVGGRGKGEGVRSGEPSAKQVEEIVSGSVGSVGGEIVTWGGGLTLSSILAVNKTLQHPFSLLLISTFQKVSPLIIPFPVLPL